MVLSRQLLDPVPRQLPFLNDITIGTLTKNGGVPTHLVLCDNPGVHGAERARTMSGQPSKIFQEMTCIDEAAAIVRSLGLDTTALRQAYSMLAARIEQQSELSPHQPRRGRPSKPNMQRILELLARHPNGLTRREIQQRLSQRVAEVAPVLQHMLATGEIVTIPAGRSVVYVLRDDPSTGQ